ncbi:MAG: phosphoribosyltransferase [Verrucomicrobia bacterium]|nr:phosphoribosyltransferase [Verrucomicrobiota bacterium]
MTFASREEAGQKLGRHLADAGVEIDLVLGLPRGGVVVAAEVARTLHLPLAVLVVRKIGHPRHREFAVGAIADNGVVVLDTDAMRSSGVDRAELDEVIAEETERLRHYQSEFHQTGAPNLRDKNVLIVDDGLATGATTEAAVLSAKKQNAASVIVAVPVASTNGVERLSGVADKVVALLTDPWFDAVGRYYEFFSQTTDEEVLALLRGQA